MPTTGLTVSLDRDGEQLVRALWSAAIATWVLGDSGTTLAVLGAGGVEVNPLVELAIEQLGTVVAIIATKALPTAVAIVAWVAWPSIEGFDPDPWRWVIPTILAIEGSRLTVHNLVQLVDLIA